MPRLKTAIILALALLTALLSGGCSSVRLAYSNAPQLAWWWLDGYADFSREQAPAARQAVDGFFDWHRRSQLPDYAAWLVAIQPQFADNMSPGQACRLQEQGREKLEPSLQRALLLAADLVPGLGEEQFASIDKRFAKVNDTMRDDFLQSDAADRAEAAFKRTLERAERIYGNLGSAQKRVIREGLATSPFNPEMWLADRQRAQRDTVQTLRKLVSERAGTEQRVAALRALVQRTERSPDPVYRAYQLQLMDYNCNFAARLHNATTAAQRDAARERLEGWVADLRALSVDPQAR
jgi:hypothetical protein